MRPIVLAIALFGLFTLNARAESRLAKVCYTTVDNGTFCTTDNLGKVQVLIYNAGWCPGCNEEMDELPAVYQQFQSSGVVFASLSGEGWNSGSQPDVTFLAGWKARHSIPFIVAGKYRDFGNAFDPPGYIPFTVILDKQGTVAKSGSLGGSDIADEVSQLIGR